MSKIPRKSEAKPLFTYAGKTAYVEGLFKYMAYSVCMYIHTRTAYDRTTQPYQRPQIMQAGREGGLEASEGLSSTPRGLKHCLEQKRSPEYLSGYRLQSDLTLREHVGMIRDPPHPNPQTCGLNQPYRRE
jgi:hypothetical protein